MKDPLESISLEQLRKTLPGKMREAFAGIERRHQRTGARPIDETPNQYLGHVQRFRPFVRYLDVESVAFWAAELGRIERVCACALRAQAERPRPRGKPRLYKAYSRPGP